MVPAEDFDRVVDFILDLVVEGDLNFSGFMVMDSSDLEKSIFSEIPEQKIVDILFVGVGSR